ncbi:unnamed protein product, partial [Vitis vinifera]
MIKQRLQLRKIQGSIASSDVLDVLLNISEDNSNEIERSHMEHLLLDLFVAGTDTTSRTLEWAIAELLHNPEKLLKSRMELLQTIGQDKQVLVNAWAIGRDPNTWENPNSFVPERFLGLDIWT